MCYHVSMINENIEKLLAAQKIDKERLHLIHDLEKGKVKMELDKTVLDNLKKAYADAVAKNDTAAAAKVLEKLKQLKQQKAIEGLNSFR